MERQDATSSEFNLRAIVQRPISPELQPFRGVKLHLHNFIAEHPFLHPKEVKRNSVKVMTGAGATQGAFMGAVIGSPLPVVGPIMGGVIGGFAGGLFCNKIGNLVTHVAENTSPGVHENEKIREIAINMVAMILRDMCCEEIIVSYIDPYDFDRLEDPVMLPSGFVYSRHSVLANMKGQRKQAKELFEKNQGPKPQEKDSYVYDDLGTPFTKDRIFKCSFHEVAVKGRMKYLIQQEAGREVDSRLKLVLMKAAELAETEKDLALSRAKMERETYVGERGRAAKEGQKHWFTDAFEKKWFLVEQHLKGVDFSKAVPIGLFGEQASGI